MKVLGRIGVSVLIILFLAVGLSYGKSAELQSLTKGVDYAAQGKFKEAREELEKVLKVDPLNESAKEVLKVVEDVIDKKIESKAAIHLFKGGAYSLKGQTDESIVEYNKAIEIDPRFAIAYRARGKAYLKKRQYDKAISDYNKAIKINPKYAMAYHHRGVAYRAKGQYDQAITDLTKAIELNPRYRMAYNNRAIAYHYQGEYDKAWEDVYKAQSLGFQVHPGFLKALRQASGRRE